MSIDWRSTYIVDFKMHSIAWRQSCKRIGIFNCKGTAPSMKKKSTIVIALLVSALAGGICFYVIGGASPIKKALNVESDNSVELTAQNASGEGMRLIGAKHGDVAPTSVSGSSYGNKAKEAPSSATLNKPNYSSISTSLDKELSTAVIDIKNGDAEGDSQEVESKSEPQINQEKPASVPAAGPVSFSGSYMASVHERTSGASGAVVLPSPQGSTSQPGLNSLPAPGSQQTPGYVVSNSPLWPSNDSSGGGLDNNRYGDLNNGQSNGQNEWFSRSQPTPNNVPEPGTLLLFGTGLLGMAFASWSRRRRAN